MVGNRTVFISSFQSFLTTKSTSKAEDRIHYICAKAHVQIHTQRLDFSIVLLNPFLFFISTFPPVRVSSCILSSSPPSCSSSCFVLWPDQYHIDTIIIIKSCMPSLQLKKIWVISSDVLQWCRQFLNHSGKSDSFWTFTYTEDYFLF